jgi:hypothetical protein
MNIIKLQTYPQYAHLPEQLRHNLNILRTNILYVVEGCCEVSCTVDQNDVKFLSLEALLEWLKDALPEYDTDFLEAALRIHQECYDQRLFDYFGVDEEDLFTELLWIKDAYELSIYEEK